MRYHISKSGKILPCKARNSCPLGTAVSGPGSKDSLDRYAEQKTTEMDKFNEYVESGRKYTKEEAAERGKFVNETVSMYIDNGLITSNIHRDKKTGEYTRARQKFHRKILDELHKKYEHIPSDGKVIFSAGLPGAGKTTVLNMLKDGQNGLDTKDYATVSSDDFKEIFAEKGMIPKIDGLHPMETSTLVHLESSYLADKFLKELGEKKKNIIYDFTCKDFKTTAGRMEILRKEGYEEKDMQIVFVDIPLEVAEQRAILRYSLGLNAAIKSKANHIGGRYLPPDVLYSNKSETGKYSSKNAEAVVDVYSYFKEKGLPKPIVYDNSGDSFADKSYKPIQIDFDTFSNR